jgi:hypothetical protein
MIDQAVKLFIQKTIVADPRRAVATVVDKMESRTLGT